MGALLFYTFIYFIGHYFAVVFNTLLRRERFSLYWSGLTGVIIVAVMHGYKIVSSAPPMDGQEGAMYALSYYVIFPVAVITGVLLYLSAKEKREKEKKNSDQQQVTNQNSKSERRDEEDDDD